MNMRIAAREFDRVYAAFVENGEFFEDPAYYPRYKSRYRYLLDCLAALGLPEKAKLLDIGGGQVAILARELLGFQTTVADVCDTYAAYLRRLRIAFSVFNLCRDAAPWTDEFDVVVMSEVIEHLPIPGHIVLEKVRQSLRCRGYLLLTTPNLHRIRNVVLLAVGREVLGRFFYPAPQSSCGHVVEYSQAHLAWQLKEAGFAIIRLDRRHFHHWPIRRWRRALYVLGFPLFAVPRFRDNLVALCHA